RWLRTQAWQNSRRHYRTSRSIGDVVARALLEWEVMLMPLTQVVLISPALWVELSMILVLLSAATAGSASVTQPPVSGETVDEVAQVLRPCRQETSVERKIELIRQFGEIRDPRVTVALMETILAEQKESPLLLASSMTLVRYHIPEKEWRMAKAWFIAR